MMGADALARQTSPAARVQVQRVKRLLADRSEADRERRRLGRLARDLVDPPRLPDLTKWPNREEMRRIEADMPRRWPPDRWIQVPDPDAPPPIPPRRRRLTLAAEVLRRELAEGPRPPAELYAGATAAGVKSERTVDEAKKLLGVRSRLVGFSGSWVWEPPPPGWVWKPAPEILWRLWRDGRA